LQQLDRHNDYFVLVKSSAGWEPAAPNFQAVAADVKDYTFAEQFRLWWIIRRLKPDLVHFLMPQQPLLYTGPSATTIHDLTTLRWHNINGNKWIYRFKLFVYRCLMWWVAHTSDALIAPTGWVKADVVKTLSVDPARIRVTHLAAEQIRGRTETPPGYDRQTKFIFFNGNVFPHKNVEGLIEAFARLKSRYPNLKLAIAGKLNQQGEELKLKTSQTKNIDWLGFVPDAQLKWLLANALVYVYPSFSEGFGLPGLEAMNAGTPLASSNATCLPEVYGPAAEYFDPSSAEEMAAAIDRLLSDRQRRRELLKLEREQLKKYSWRRTAEQTLAVYRQILDKL
jgi:glycosyltransferase involved in cell wall biosynthesis